MDNKWGRLKRMIWDIWINGILNARIIYPSYRYKIYNLFGMKLKRCRIRSGCTFDGNKIEVGRGVFINVDCHFDLNEKIKIGDNTYIAAEAMFLTSSHHLGDSDKRAGANKDSPIEVGKGCWIGARATILQGVKIGDGSVIAAGSVVNKDCKPNGLYAGVPAKHIKDLD